MTLDKDNARLRAAFHEAGHALVMWCLGVRVEGVAVADEGKRGFILAGRGYPGCSGVAVGNGGYREGSLFVRLHEQQTRGVQYPAWAEECANNAQIERQKMRDDMTWGFAGVVAEWLFFDVGMDNLKAGGGRRDVRDIADLAEEYACSELDYAVVLKMVHDAECAALALLLARRELLARLALVVFEKGHISGAAFENLLHTWTSPALDRVMPFAG